METPAAAIAQLIQLAVAPVFLLAGIGSILNVLTHRLARVVDRARKLQADLPGLEETERAVALGELRMLDTRRTRVNAAIGCCTASALFVCLVVAILFVADLADFAFGRPIAYLFILAMLLLIAGLLFFLAEIRLATRALVVRRALLPSK